MGSNLAYVDRSAVGERNFNKDLMARFGHTVYQTQDEPVSNVTDGKEFPVVELEQIMEQSSATPPSEQIFQEELEPGSHPYLQRLGQPDPRMDITSHVEPADFRSLRMKSVLIGSAVGSRYEQLHLHPLELLDFVDELSDQLLISVYNSLHQPDELIFKELPHLYIVLKRSSDRNFDKVIKYLHTQRTLSFAISTVKTDAKERSGSRIVNVILASEHYIFLFDCRTLDLDSLMKSLRFCLEDARVVKVMRNAEQTERILNGLYGIALRNVFDVVAVECGLEKLYGLSQMSSYTFLQFKKRYGSDSHCFGRFPDQDFLCQFGQGVPYGVITQSSELIRELLKQVVYLQLIRRCQLGVCMSDVVEATELAECEVFCYRDPHWKSGDDQWDETPVQIPASNPVTVESTEDFEWK